MTDQEIKERMEIINQLPFEQKLVELNKLYAILGTDKQTVSIPSNVSNDSIGVIKVTSINAPSVTSIQPLEVTQMDILDQSSVIPDIQKAGAFNSSAEKLEVKEEPKKSNAGKIGIAAGIVGLLYFLNKE